MRAQKRRRRRLAWLAALVGVTVTAAAAGIGYLCLAGDDAAPSSPLTLVASGLGTQAHADPLVATPPSPHGLRHGGPPPPAAVPLPRGNLLNADFRAGDLHGWNLEGRPQVRPTGTPGVFRARLGWDGSEVAPTLSQRLALPRQGSTLEVELHVSVPGAVLTATVWPDAEDPSRFAAVDVIVPATAARLPCHQVVHLTLPGGGRGAAPGRLALALRSRATGAVPASRPHAFVDVGRVEVVAAPEPSAPAKHTVSRAARPPATAHRAAAPKAAPKAAPRAKKQAHHVAAAHGSHAPRHPAAAHHAKAAKKKHR